MTQRQSDKQAPNPNKVIVGMSGGVDSSVSALLLKLQGYEVEGLFMKNWNEDDGTEYCTAATDLMDAAAVCHKLDIPLHTANFAGEYWDNVFSHFLDEYKNGRTPNPDILCNKEIKFKVFLEHAVELGAAQIATGHYAQVVKSDDEARLLKGRDPNKDQSYFLYRVDESAFSASRFPIGDMHKSEVRTLAEKHGLITHNKKDSTGICFIGERRFKDFLETYLPAQPGDIVDEHGKVMGEHQGLMYYTIGQRQGLGIGGVAGADESPWYVAVKNLQDNTLVVVQGTQHPLLYASRLKAIDLHWINQTPLQLQNGDVFECKAKTRYRQADQTCRIRQEDGFIFAEFSEAQRAITPGQSVVFYTNEHCLGGGIIASAL